MKTNHSERSVAPDPLALHALFWHHHISNCNDNLHKTADAMQGRAKKTNQSERFVRVVVLVSCKSSSSWHRDILQRRRNLATFLKNVTRHSVRHILPMKCARRENETKRKICSSCSARVVHVVFFLAALHFRTQREPL